MPYIFSPNEPCQFETQVAIKEFTDIKAALKDEHYFEEWKDLFALIPTWKAFTCPNNGQVFCCDPKSAHHQLLYSVPQDAFAFVGCGGFGSVVKYRCRSLGIKFWEEYCLKEIPLTKEDFKLFLRESCLEFIRKGPSETESPVQDCDPNTRDTVIPEFKQIFGAYFKELINFLAYLGVAEVTQNSDVRLRSMFLQYSLRNFGSVKLGMDLQKFLYEHRNVNLPIDETLCELLTEHADSEFAVTAAEMLGRLSNREKRFRIGNMIRGAPLIIPLNEWIVLDPTTKSEPCLFLQSFFYPNTLCQYMNRPQNRKPFKFCETRHEIGTLIFYLMQQLNDFHSQNCIHRDIKPSNIFGELTDIESIPFPFPKLAKTVPLLRIGDFSIARKIKDEELLFDNARTESARTTTELNRDQYAAPEIFSRNGYSRPVDIYAMGVIYYEILTGTNFKGHLSNEFVKFYPQECDLIRKMVDLEPSNRPNAPSVVSEVKKVNDSIADLISYRMILNGQNDEIVRIMAFQLDRLSMD